MWVFRAFEEDNSLPNCRQCFFKSPSSLNLSFIAVNYTVSHFPMLNIGVEVNRHFYIFITVQVLSFSSSSSSDSAPLLSKFEFYSFSIIFNIIFIFRPPETNFGAYPNQFCSLAFRLIRYVFVSISAYFNFR